MKYLRLERGHVPRRIKKRQKINKCIFILALVSAITVKIIHALIK
ncbi:hypothetical protein [Crassaminicella thermophila]|nr:hypothetical protein [Crassaminicella thermophila]